MCMAQQPCGIIQVFLKSFTQAVKSSCNQAIKVDEVFQAIKLDSPIHTCRKLLWLSQQQADANNVADFHDSARYQRIKDDPLMSQDPRNVILWGCADGAQVFKSNHSSQHSSLFSAFRYYISTCLNMMGANHDQDCNGSTSCWQVQCLFC